MPVFQKRSPMPVSAAALFAYHARPGALDRLIPPWQAVRIVERSDNIRDGARVVMDMKLAPLVWKRWIAEHFDYVEGERFRDRQISGPFKAWTHTHRTLDAAPESILEDEVHYELPGGSLGRALAGRRVERDVERMFRFRHARTRNDLQRQSVFADGPRLTIAVSGARGAVGSRLAPFLTSAGHRVMKLVRTHLRERSRYADEIMWDANCGAADQERLADCDALVHLAGANIADHRWTKRRKQLYWKSRVDTTRSLCEMLAYMPTKIRTLICASATGIYGDRNDEPLSEDASLGEGWTSDLCAAWEAATKPATDLGIRVVHLRIGPALAANSGALAKMLMPTRFGIAGRMGSGKQFVPWIAMDDLVYVIHEALMRDAWSGPINAVTGSVTQAELVHTLGRVLHRPTIAPMPAFIVRALFGEMGKELLLASANVQPTRLRELGFAASSPTLEAALRFELGR